MATPTTEESLKEATRAAHAAIGDLKRERRELARAVEAGKAELTAWAMKVHDDLQEDIKVVGEYTAKVVGAGSAEEMLDAIKDKVVEDLMSQAATEMLRHVTKIMTTRKALDMIADRVVREMADRMLEHGEGHFRREAEREIVSAGSAPHALMVRSRERGSPRSPGR